MPIRRYHKKSRSGCSQCRSRRVKCDETHPICANCVRAGLKCNYPNGPPSALPSPPQSAESATSSDLSQPSIHCEASQPSFDSLDLFLMNHFTSVTSLDLINAREYQYLWQRDIPSHARSSPMLMHGILSLSALHLALVRPSETHTYWTRALHHHNLGLRLFNSQIQSSWTQDPHPTFIFSLILTIWAYGSASAAGEHMGLDDILSLLDIVRGCRTVFDLYKDDILAQTIGQLISRPNPPSDFEELSPPICRTLENVRMRAENSVQVSAVEQIQVKLKKAVAKGDARLGMGWPATLEDTLWSQIRSRDPIAILIFAHHAMLLRHYDRHCWWMVDWSDRVMQAVEGKLIDSDKALLVAALHSIDMLSQYNPEDGSN